MIGKNTITYFVGIGAQKAGTTWLSEYFYSHPDVYMSPYKEMHYFDSKLLWRNASDNWRLWLRRRQIDLTKYGPENSLQTFQQSEAAQKLYLQTCMRSDKAYREFLDLGAEGKSAAGEITPNYTDLNAKGFAYIDKCLPGCKFILLMRNPVERFRSQLSMDRNKGMHRLYRTANVSRASRHILYKYRGNYKRTIEEVEKAVGPDRLLISFYESLFDPGMVQQEVSKICAHINVRYIQPNINLRPKETKKKQQFSGDDREFLVKFHAESYRYLYERTGGILPESWKEDLKYL